MLVYTLELVDVKFENVVCCKLIPLVHTAKGVYKSVGCASYCAEECKLSCVYIAMLTTVGPVLIVRI